MESQKPHQIVGRPVSDTTLVVGAPGSGKTTLLVDRFIALVDQADSDQVAILLTPSRNQASELRDRVGLALGRTTRGPRVRSVAAFAFALVQAAHRTHQLPAPDLLSASQTDADIESVLAGHSVDGSGPNWPEPLTEVVRGMPAFRTELREWMARATEHGLDNDTLLRLAAEYSRPEWAAAAEFRREFQEVIASARPAAFDSAEIIRRAIVVLDTGLPEGFTGVEHVLVDDAHDVTTAGWDLLRALRAQRVGLTVVAEPDVAGNTFRGSEPTGLSALATDWGVTPVVLDQVYRHGGTLRESVSLITGRLGTAGLGTQRQARGTADAPGQVFTVVAPSLARETNDIARLLSDAHSRDGVPFSQMAVITRSGQRVGALVRELGFAGIPARARATGRPLRDQPAARGLLDLVALGRGIQPITPASAVATLTGLYGGMTHQELRRLRFALRVERDPTEPYVPVDTLIAEGLKARGGFATLPANVAKKAHTVAEILDDIRREPASVPINQLLWQVWAATGVAPQWRAQSQEREGHASSAHRALDAVVALFHQANDFVEAQPGASLELFLESVLDADVPDDVVLPEPTWPAVTVSTPPGVAGREFELVVVAGVEDGVWPDLRLRGSLLHAHQLVRAARGEADDVLDERKIVKDDELRMFALALSRATRTLVVTATESEEAQPSPLFHLVDSVATRVPSLVEPPLSLRSVTGRLRRELVSSVSEGSPRSTKLAQDLAVLASWGAPGADPESWWGVRPMSSDTPLYLDEEVPVSPSSLELLEESPLEWFLGSLARHDSAPERGLGSLIHAAWEEHPQGDSDRLWSAIEPRFGELDYEAGWIENYQRRIAKGMVRALADYTADRDRAGYQVLATEKSFQIRHGRALMNGIIDRIEGTPEGNLLVVDLKTGRHKTDAEVAQNPQMFAYQLAVENPELTAALGRDGAVGAGAVLLFVKSGVRGKLYRLATQEPIGPEARAEFFTRIEKAVSIMAASEFQGEAKSWGPVGTPSRHRWHFIGQVCGDD